MTRVTAAQIQDLRRDFVVVEETARKPDGTLDQDAGAPSGPIFNLTYYNRVPGKDADDLGKQIFTTLATAFVSVVSRYFGSSTASSGIGAGLKAAAGEGTSELVRTTPDKVAGGRQVDLKPPVTDGAAPAAG